MPRSSIALEGARACRAWGDLYAPALCIVSIEEPRARSSSREPITAHRKLVDAFRDRLVEKTYVSLLHGKIRGEAGSIDLPVARDLRRRSRMTARRPEGREARTNWRALLRLDGFTLIEAELHTGRTHQIRVHFSALGYPVVGDTPPTARRARCVLDRSSSRRSAGISFMPRAWFLVIPGAAGRSSCARRCRPNSSGTGSCSDPPPLGPTRL